MKITTKWLQEQGACAEGVKWFLKQKTQNLSVLLNKALKQKRFSFANWGIIHLMSPQQQVQYACFAALCSLPTFEKAYPNDKRPRKTILAALRWAIEPTKKNRSAAWSAAMAAKSATESATKSVARLMTKSVARSVERAMERAALSAESAAWSAAMAAESAAESAAWSAAWSVERAAESAAWSAALSVALSAARAAKSAAWQKLLLYGLKIVDKQLVIKSVDHFMGVR